MNINGAADENVIPYRSVNIYEVLPTLATFCYILSYVCIHQSVDKYGNGECVVLWYLETAKQLHWFWLLC